VIPGDRVVALDPGGPNVEHFAVRMISSTFFPMSSPIAIGDYFVRLACVPDPATPEPTIVDEAGTVVAVNGDTAMVAFDNLGSFGPIAVAVSGLVPEEE
jgi:hypothetical protein